LFLGGKLLGFLSSSMAIFDGRNEVSIGLDFGGLLMELPRYFVCQKDVPHCKMLFRAPKVDIGA
jgi:hypothetical protein